MSKNQEKGYTAQKILVRKKNGETDYIFIANIISESKTVNPLKKFLSFKKTERL